MRSATELARLIGRVRRLNRSSIRRELSEHGQSLHDWQVIANVKWQGPMTQVALAEHIGSSAASVSRLLDSLQRRGLIRREADRKDRRRITVHLTVKGESWYELWHRPVMGVLDAIMSKLTKSEQLLLEKLLTKLLA